MKEKDMFKPAAAALTLSFLIFFIVYTGIRPDIIAAYNPEEVVATAPIDPAEEIAVAGLEPGGEETIQTMSGQTGGLFIVNINTATAQELEQLPGIGPKTAQSILEYRQQNGTFIAIEELKLISGIGNVKFDAIKENIVIE